MKKTRNLIIIAAVLAVVVVLAVLNGKRQQTALAVVTARVQRTTFSNKLPENGIVQRPQVVTVPTLIAGNIGHIYVRPGDRVTAGEVLATVVNPTLQSNAASSQADYDSAVANIQTARVNEQNSKVGYVAAVETARSNLQEAERVYRADVSLYANKAIPRNQLDTDRAKVDQARVQYDQAERQLQLGAVTGYGQNSIQYAQAAAQKAQIVNRSNQQQVGFSTLTAPFDGIVQTVPTQTGDPLTPLHEGDPVVQGQALFTVAAGDSYIVKAEVDEQDIISVRDGQQVDVTGQDFPGQTLTGHVVSIAPVAIKSTDPSSTARQVLTTIRLDRSPSFLRDGMSVDVDILTTNVKRALVVPSAAINQEGTKSYVYVLRGKRARKTYVKTGASNGMQTVVTSGLVSGETIVASHDALLHDGAAVRPMPAGKASPPA